MPKLSSGGLLVKNPGETEKAAAVYCSGSLGTTM
jgi:hypothetical protein